jgi:hypothetical protein
MVLSVVKRYEILVSPRGTRQTCRCAAPDPCRRAQGEAIMSSSASVPRYGWITDPPIVFVDWAAVAERVALFAASLKEWGSVGGGTDLATRINTHGGNARFIAELIEKQLYNPYTPVFEYRLAGMPIALLQLDLRGYEGIMKVKNLATHPGSEGAGGIMTEFALNQTSKYNTQSQSHSGVDMFEPGFLFLESLDKSSTAAYEALGFKAMDGDEMLLDANKSAKWAKSDSKWRLVGKPGQYLMTPDG